MSESETNMAQTQHASGQNPVVALLADNEQEILSDWVAEQTKTSTQYSTPVKNSELKRQCAEFLSLFTAAMQNDSTGNIQSSLWMPVRDMLTTLSRARAVQGFTPTQTAMFVFSLKQPLFSHFQDKLANGTNETLLSAVWQTTQTLDQLGLFTTEIYQKSREEVIIRQQEELLELSTPVIKLWQGILALPLIGTLDSARTQVVMESLLQAIVDTGSDVAIIDITGVPTVDTLVSQHLLKTVAAARLMGADCIISGIRPQIAQTIVHLGVDLSEVTTKATLAEAFVLALRRTAHGDTSPSATQNASRLLRAG